MWTIVDREWRYGDTMCKLFKFFQTFGLTSSTYLVVAIGLDRLWAIVTPLSRSEAQLLSLVSCLSWNKWNLDGCSNLVDCLLPQNNFIKTKRWNFLAPIGAQEMLMFGCSDVWFKLVQSSQSSSFWLKSSSNQSGISQQSLSTQRALREHSEST